MLNVKEGDLFLHAKPPCIITHGCNSRGKMGSGFAKEIRHRFPFAYASYIASHRDSPLEVGDLLIVVCGKFHICNAITQKYYGRDKTVVYVDYDAVKKTMKEVAQYARVNKNLPIHLPFIGGGFANGDRHTLLTIFKEAFHDVQATLWVDEMSPVIKTP